MYTELLGFDNPLLVKKILIPTVNKLYIRDLQTLTIIDKSGETSCTDYSNDSKS